MQIKLENIGIVKNSSIELNGLTVITGKNNSGKSTVGKTLYALLDAVSNISEKYEIDRYNYMVKILEENQSIMSVFRLIKYGQMMEDSPTDDDILRKYSYLKKYINKDYKRKTNSNSRELKLFIEELVNELSEIKKKVVFSDPSWNKIGENIPEEDRKKIGAEIQDLFWSQFDTAFLNLTKLLETIKRDPQQIVYTKESINQTLRKEFARQLQPVRGQNGSSIISLTDGDKVYFSLTIENNNLVDENNNKFMAGQYKKVYLVDDPFILDNLERDQKLNQLFAFDSEESLLNSGHILSHNDKLRLTLTQNKQQSIFEQTILNDKLKNIRKKIDEILPGTFDLSTEGRYYVQNGMKLQVSNLATGSKMFSIIKILLDKGELDESTMLILDEPEAHLHPKWQNAFAEVIALLVKELGVNVLLTTHSPNFVLALDAYMRKYKLEEKSNFYQTEILEDGFVQYNCMDDDMGKIYEDFLKYLSEVKMLRNCYMYHDEEDTDSEADGEDEEE